MNLYFDSYTPQEKESFKIHMLIALACLPFYYLMPTMFGLFVSPYVFFLAVQPKTEYLLPVIIHIAYGSQQRYFFCMGCFLYVLLNFTELYKYKLQVMYWLYLSLFPFFIWYLCQKYFGPRYVGGIGEVTGGIGEYFVFSTVFWGVLVVKKLNQTFFRGLLVFMLFLLTLLSVAGAKDEDTGALITGINMFSREVFFAMPLLAASFVYFLTRRDPRNRFELFASGLGVVVIALDFVGFLRLSITFTNLGGCVFAAMIVLLGIKKSKVLLNIFSPLVLFVVLFSWVLASQYLVETYGGIYSDEGEYQRMSMTSVSSFAKKLQRKIVDDRAQVWKLNMDHILEMWRNHQAVWIDTSPYIDQKVWVEGKGEVRIVTDMGAHNIILQLLRNYGFYGGLGLLLLYVWYFSRKQNITALIKCNKSPVVILLGTCLSQGVIGGHTGHYPIQLAFGPVLFACLGACWRFYYDQKQFDKRLMI